MICEPCARRDHKYCHNIWTLRKGLLGRNSLEKRVSPSTTHCFCQHRKNAEYVKGTNGNGS